MHAMSKEAQGYCGVLGGARFLMRDVPLEDDALS